MKELEEIAGATGLNSFPSPLNVSSSQISLWNNSSFYRNAEILSLLLSSSPAITGLVSLYVVILTIGLIGNSLVAAAICGQKIIRNLLLLNLCISDFFVCSMSGPISIVAALNTVWTFGVLPCKLAFFLQTIPVAASTLSLMMLSLDRYTSIKHPRIISRAQNQRRVMHCMVVAIWVGAALVSAPILWVREITVDEKCQELWPSNSFRTTYTIVLSLVVYVIPSLTVAICHHSVGHKLYATSLKAAAANGDIPLPMPIIPSKPKEVIIVASIHNDASSKMMQYRQGGDKNGSLEGGGSQFRHHRHAAIRRKKRVPIRRPHSSRKLVMGLTRPEDRTTRPQGKAIRMKRGLENGKPPLTKQMSRQSLNSRKRLANMLVALVVVFVTCWFPYVIVKLYLEFKPEMHELLQSILPFCLLLGHTHSAINPVVYWSLNKQSLQVNSSCYDWLKFRTNRGNSNQDRKFYFAGHLKFLSNHNNARNNKHPPPSSTNEAALGIFHPRYTIPKPQDRLNQKRESSVYLA